MNIYINRLENRVPELMIRKLRDGKDTDIFVFNKHVMLEYTRQILPFFLEKANLHKYTEKCRSVRNIKEICDIINIIYNETDVCFKQMQKDNLCDIWTGQEIVLCANMWNDFTNTESHVTDNHIYIMQYARIAKWCISDIIQITNEYNDINSTTDTISRIIVYSITSTIDYLEYNCYKNSKNNEDIKKHIIQLFSDILSSV